MTAILCVSPAARKPILDALLAVAWADGRFTEQERKDVRGAALAFGLVDADAPYPSRSVRLSDLEVDAMSLVERRIAYAAAAWMSLADDVRVPAESLILRRLRELLRLHPEDAQSLEELAYSARRRAEDDERRWREVNELVARVARRSRPALSHGAAA